MTNEEAIKHCDEVAEELENRFSYFLESAKSDLMRTEETKCKECASEHRQLAEWLRELKAWRTFGLRVGEIIALYLPQEELKKLEQKISEVNKEDAE